jgi:hypothetical protein
LGIVSRRICPTFVAKHEARFACRLEKIFRKWVELKRKIILERKQYNSKMASRVKVSL